MTKALRVPDDLEHILQAIERIGRYTADMDEAGFLNSYSRPRPIRNKASGPSMACGELVRPPELQ